MNLPELKPMPPAAVVQVIRYRKNPHTDDLEPWPVATIHIDLAGKIEFRGDAGRAFEPLLAAARRAALRIAHQGVIEAIEEAKKLKEEAWL
jgi:hypothetical protein